MKRSSCFRLVLGGLFAAIGVLAAASGSSQSQIPDSLLPAIQTSTVTGPVAGTDVIHFAVGLNPRHPAELQAYCDAVSDPRSPNYQHWLTPAQVGEQFGALPIDVSTVSAYLQSKGLSLELSADNRMCVLVSGTVAQIQNAFSAQIKQLRGKDPMGATIFYRANITPLMAPPDVVRVITCVSGVENYTRAYPKNTSLLTPPLTRGLYNNKAAYTLGFRGQGRSVAVTNFDGYRLTNLPLYISTYGLPVPPGGAGSNVVVVVCGTPSGTGPPQGEGDLDIQMELGMAPLATILVYDGIDRLTVTTKEANDNRADVLSESYGFYPSQAEATAYHNQHLAMTAQGQTYMEATGDFGTTFTGFYPNIEPEILQVGGTVATVDSNTGSRVSEVSWSGSTGGWYPQFSIPFNTLPSWMRGTGVPTNINYRLNPDIALHSSGGNPFGGAYDFVYNGSLNGDSAGTSFASPMTAGCIAVVEERLAAAGHPPRLGRMQDVIYLQNQRPDVWKDITTGPGNGTLPNGQQGLPHVGWDFVTGWGAPDFNALFNALLTSSSPTPVLPTQIQTVIGTYIIGDVSSASHSDGIYYEVGSTGIPQFGQAAGVATQFFVPQNSIAITVDLQTNAGIAGGTNMVWLYNWGSGHYDLIGSTAMNASGSADKRVTVAASRVPQYIGANGEVDVLLRGHLPIRPFNNFFPNPFTYKIDLIQLLVL